MIVRADLDRSIASVGDDQRDRRAAGVEFEFAGFGEKFSGDDGALLKRWGDAR